MIQKEVEIMHPDAENYLKHLKSRSVERTTFGNMELFLKNFFDFIGNKNVNEITTGDIENYIASLWDKKRRPGTINLHQRYLKMFFKFHKRTDIVLSIKLKKVIPEQRSIPSQNSMVEKIDKISDTLAKAVCMTIYGTGIKRDELIKLQWENLKFSPVNRVVIGSRVTIFPLDVQKFLREVYVSRYNHPKYVFVNKNGKPLTPYVVSYLVKINLDNMTPELLRKAFANHLGKNGVPLTKIMEFLGLNDIASLERYIQPMDYETDDALSKHPYHDILVLEKYDATGKIGGLLDQKMSSLEHVLTSVLIEKGEDTGGILGLKLGRLAKIKASDKKKHEEILHKFNFLNDIWVTFKHHQDKIVYGDEIKIMTERGDIVTITSKAEKFDTKNFENKVNEYYSEIHDYLSSL
jgi:site-specific recombinase XerD